MNKEYILYGANGHAKVIIDALQLNEIENIILVDDNSNVKQLMGYEVASPKILDNKQKTYVLISVGNNKIRKEIVNKLDTNYHSVIHPNVVIAESVKIDKGTFVAAGVVINPDTKIGNHVIINTSASIDHDCNIENFVHIAPNATLCGGISIGEGTLIGAGATILPNLKIGSWITVGAGAVITKDISDYSVVVGNPARVLRISNID